MRWGVKRFRTNTRISSDSHLLLFLCLFLIKDPDPRLRWRCKRTSPSLEMRRDRFRHFRSGSALISFPCYKGIERRIEEKKSGENKRIKRKNWQSRRTSARTPDRGLILKWWKVRDIDLGGTRGVLLVCPSRWPHSFRGREREDMLQHILYNLCNGVSFLLLIIPDLPHVIMILEVEYYMANETKHQ